MHHTTQSPGKYLQAATAIALLTGCLLAIPVVASTAITDITINRAVVSQLAAFPETSVETLAFSPDSLTLACGLGDGRLLLMDVQSGSTILASELHEAAITALSYSPDGQWLASSDINGRVIVWDAKTGETVTSWDLGLAVHDVAFSPQGTWLACVGAMRSVLMWEAGTWERLPSINGHTGSVYSFAISPEEDLLVTGAGDADPTIRVWSLPDGVQLRTDLYEGRVHDIEYSSKDKHTAITGTQMTISLWEVDRAEYLHLIFGFRGTPQDAAYSSRGNALVAVDDAGALRFLRVPSWYERRKISFDEALSAVDYSYDRLYIACGDAAGTVFLLTVP
ncbi:WD40 repeat domain-containing protein [Candidatus Bipolaricaulota bacterium]